MIFRTTLWLPLNFFFCQYFCKVKGVQCNNGCEFNNSSSRQFFRAHGMQLRMSCPYTYPQNGKAKRMLRTTNNIVRTLLFHASMSPQYWVESLHTITYLLNHLPTKTITASCYPKLCLWQPHISLLLVPPGVSSSTIPHTTKGIIALIFPLTTLWSPDTLCLMTLASPSPSWLSNSNDYEFLSEVDLVLSPIETRLSAGTPATTASDLTVPPGGLTTPVVEVGGPTAPPDGPTTYPTGALLTPCSGLTYPHHA
jgi:hypothetical protein